MGALRRPVAFRHSVGRRVFTLVRLQMGSVHYNWIWKDRFMPMSLRCVLVLSCVVFNGGCGLFRGGSAPAEVEMANQFLKAGNDSEAEIHFRKAIQKDPAYGEAPLGLARMKLKKNELGEAHQYFKQAVLLLPQREDVKLEYGELCLGRILAGARRDKELRGEVERIAKELLAKDPNSYRGLRFQGYLAFTGDQFASAAQLFQRADQAKPMQPEVVVPLVESLIKNKEGEAAERIALRMIEAKKDNPVFYDILYLHYTERKQTEKATAILARKVENNPGEIAYLLQLATQHENTNQAAKAREIIDMIVASTGDYPNARMQVGDFEAKRKRFDAALGHYEAGLRESPAAKSDYQKRISALLAAQGKKDDAARMVETILASHPEDSFSLQMRAGLLLRTNKPGDASAALRQIENLIKTTPKSAILHYDLGLAYLASGEAGRARTAFVTAIQLNPAYVPPRFLLAELAMQARDSQTALEQAHQVRALQPGSIAGRVLLARAWMVNGQIVKARQQIDQALKLAPENREVLLHHGILLLNERYAPQAEKVFRAIYRPEDGDGRARDGIAESLVAQNKGAAAVQFLQSAVSASAQPLGARKALLALAMRTGQMPVALENAKAVAAAYPASADWQMLLGDVQRGSGDAAGAIAAYEKALQLKPMSHAIVSRLGSLLAEAGRREDAIAALRRFLAADPQNSMAMNDLAFLLADGKQQLDEALALIQKALAIRPQDPNFSDTLGWIYHQQGQYDRAQPIFSTLANKHPARGPYRLHYGLNSLAQGNTVVAKREFDAALASGVSSKEDSLIRSHLAKLR